MVAGQRKNASSTLYSLQNAPVYETPVVNLSTVVNTPAESLQQLHSLLLLAKKRVMLFSPVIHATPLELSVLMQVQDSSGAYIAPLGDTGSSSNLRVYIFIEALQGSTLPDDLPYVSATSATNKTLLASSLSPELGWWGVHFRQTFDEALVLGATLQVLTLDAFGKSTDDRSTIYSLFPQVALRDNIVRHCPRVAQTTAYLTVQLLASTLSAAPDAVALACQLGVQQKRLHWTVLTNSGSSSSSSDNSTNTTTASELSWWQVWAAEQARRLQELPGATRFCLQTKTLTLTANPKNRRFGCHLRLYSVCDQRSG